MSTGFSGFDPWLGQAEATARRIKAERARDAEADIPDSQRTGDDEWDPKSSPLPSGGLTRSDTSASADAAEPKRKARGRRKSS